MSDRRSQRKASGQKETKSVGHGRRGKKVKEKGKETKQASGRRRRTIQKEKEDVAVEPVG